MIDTHTHLSDPKFSGDLEEVRARARSAGVVAMISPATNLVDAKKVAVLTQKYDEVYGLVGIYPGEAKEESWESELAEMWRLLATNKKIVGIGEIGLDEGPLARNPQLEHAVFEAQLDYAQKHDYPVVIHTRNTEEAMGKVFRSREKLPRGHMHCFSGSQDWLEYVLARGFCVGFDGNVTYKSAGELRELARRVPLTRLLLETDSPYLPPEGKRGTRNESANVRITAEFLAQLRGESLEELVTVTTQNAKNLFGI